MLHALIALMVLLWAANFIIAKFALREFPPLVLSGLRMWIAAALILPVYWWQQRRRPESVSREDLKVLLGVGACGLAMNQVFFVVGLSQTSVAHSALLIGMTPVIVLIMAAIRGQERLTGRKLAGMAMAMAGVIVLKTFEDRPLSGVGPTWTGDLITLAGVTLFSSFTVFGKTARERHSSVAVSAYAYAGAAIALTPLVGLEASRFAFSKVTPAGWASLAYMAIFSSVVCYLIYYYALGHMAPSRLSALSYLQPPLAASMGVVALGEPLTLSFGAATAIILFGVGLAERG